MCGRHVLGDFTPKRYSIRGERQAYAKPFTTFQLRRRPLRPWLPHYNLIWLHAGLRYQPPVTNLQSAA